MFAFLHKGRISYITRIQGHISHAVTARGRTRFRSESLAQRTVILCKIEVARRSVVQRLRLELGAELWDLCPLDVGRKGAYFLVG